MFKRNNTMLIINWNGRFKKMSNSQEYNLYFVLPLIFVLKYHQNKTFSSMIFI